jgi:hypothetical protein
VAVGSVAKLNSETLLYYNMSLKHTLKNLWIVNFRLDYVITVNIKGAILIVYSLSSLCSFNFRRSKYHNPVVNNIIFRYPVAMMYYLIGLVAVYSAHK